MITTNTILQIDITEELTCPHIAATHPSTPNLHKANESRPKSSRQAFFNSLLKPHLDIHSADSRNYSQPRLKKGVFTIVKTG
ncbi:MAG: hypothetical protein E5299_02517 [Burkholderia gladioli]|nr:MAG: hypothetical protein E5299_02517 [Burkholderia gladioli]